MCDYLGYGVQRLKRVRIMHIQLDHLPIGTWRNLTETELKEINRLVAKSIKTEEASVNKKEH
jgi:23S rRNA pseudouridine2604 synthase